MNAKENIKDNFPIYHTNWLNRLTIIDVVQAAANNYARGLLLDVGCGAKQYQKLFDDKVEAYLGLDLRIPSPQLSEAGPDILASALRAPLPNNTFDTVVSFQVLEHVPEPHIMLVEIARILKPGGYLILMAPQMWNLHEIPNDYFRYTRYGLTYLAERAGLAVIKIQPISGFWIRVGLVMSYRIHQILLGRRVRSLRVIQLAIRFMIIISNLAFCGIDRLWSRLDDPINNLLVAQKCKHLD